ncbi:hypothetical protein QP140_03640 [Corynebacterium sp. UMB9976]|uniref:hypothetical protein n=1 Tax=Corynebacterium sp. UMB9976 TaxID=3046354 RepID=UPI00254C7849|nr:hypothetical protein [Corynebacterium sp. UMB9976]MDK6301688.1 hypothetical protein [Corynebacterium sp. UMB9976]
MTSSRTNGEHEPGEGSGSALGEAPTGERGGEPVGNPSRETDWVFAASNGFAHRVGDPEELHQLLAAALQAPPAAGLEWIQVQHAVEAHVYVAFDVADGTDAATDGTDAATVTDGATDAADPVATDAATDPATGTDSGQQKWRVSADESTRPAMGKAAGAVLTPDEAAQLAWRLL